MGILHRRGRIPFSLSPKRYTSIRITLNDKRLNAVSVFDKFLLPRIDYLFGTFGSGKVFATFDLVSIILLTIVIDPGSLAMTSFITPQGLNSWGCFKDNDGSPRSLVIFMGKVISGLNSVANYVDDAIVFETTPRRYVLSQSAFSGSVAYT